MSLDHSPRQHSLSFSLQHPDDVRHVRRLVRLYAERSGVGEPAADRAEQLVVEMLGTDHLPCTIELTETAGVLRLCARYRTEGAYKAFARWRAQHAAGVEGWRQFMGNLADQWGESGEMSGC